MTAPDFDSRRKKTKVKKFGTTVWSRTPTRWGQIDLISKCVISFTHPEHGDCTTGFRIAR